jgi:hypothetical protein
MLMLATGAMLTWMMLALEAFHHLNASIDLRYYLTD